MINKMNTHKLLMLLKFYKFKLVRQFSTESKIIKGYGFTLFQANSDMSSLEKVELNKRQLVTNFKDKFPLIDLNDYDSIMRYLQMSVEGKDFFSNYKRVTNVLSNIPKSFLDSGIDIEDWLKVQAKHVALVKLKEKKSTLTINAVNEYNASIARIEVEFAAQTALFNGLELVLDINSRSLDQKDQIELANEADSFVRKSLTKDKIRNKQLEFIKYYQLNLKLPDSFLK
jgi:hypothetical protein